MLESAVRGFHVYRADWTPVLGEQLIAVREPDNPEDGFAVSLKKGERTVGHVPREMSKLCWLFLRRGTIAAEVLSSRKRRSPISIGGLEIPCLLKFSGSGKDIEKLRSILNRLKKIKM